MRGDAEEEEGAEDEDDEAVVEASLSSLTLLVSVANSSNENG